MRHQFAHQLLVWRTSIPFAFNEARTRSPARLEIEEETETQLRRAIGIRSIKNPDLPVEELRFVVRVVAEGDPANLSDPARPVRCIFSVAAAYALKLEVVFVAGCVEVAHPPFARAEVDGQGAIARLAGVGFRVSVPSGATTRLEDEDGSAVEESFANRGAAVSIRWNCRMRCAAGEERAAHEQDSAGSIHGRVQSSLLQQLIP